MYVYDPYALHINIFSQFGLQTICELNPYWDNYLNSQMALDKLITTSVHSLVPGQKRMGEWLCQGVYSPWKVEMVQESICRAVVRVREYQ